MTLRLDKRIALVAAGLLALALLVGGLATGAIASKQSDLRVTAAGASNTESAFDLDQIQRTPDRGNAQFETVNAGQVFVETGYSLRTVLEEAASRNSKLAFEDAPFVVVDAPGGGERRIEAAQLDRPIFFKDGDRRALLIQDGSSWRLERFTTTIGIQIGKYRDFSVTVFRNPNDAEVDLGTRVGFGTNVNDDEGDGPYRYAWNFGDGTRLKASSKGAVSHRYKKAGNYQINVKVTDSLGRSANGFQQIQVGKPEKSDKNRTGGGKKKNGSANGSVDGDGTPGSTPSTGSPGGGTPGAGLDAGGAPSPGGNQPSQQDQKEEPAQPVNDGLEEVSGELVSSQTPAATFTPPSPQSAGEALREGQLKSDGAFLSGVQLTAIGVVLLLAIGIGVEARGSRFR